MKEFPHAYRALVSYNFCSLGIGCCSCYIRYRSLYSLEMYWMLLLIWYLVGSQNFCFELRSMNSMMHDPGWLGNCGMLLRLGYGNRNSLNCTYSRRKKYLGCTSSHCEILNGICSRSNRSTSTRYYIVYLQDWKALYYLVWSVAELYNNTIT